MSNIDLEEESNRDRKRQQFEDGGSGASPGRAGRWMMGAVALALLVGVGAWFWGGNASDKPRGGGAAPAPALASPPPLPLAVAENGAFRIPLADLASGEAQFFEHRPATGLPVRFFAIKSSDGTHRAALDACAVCYAGRKGYQQNGNEMLCRKCGRSFPSEVIDDATGGCHPIRVERAVEGDALVVRAADVEQADAPHAAAASAGRPPMMTPPSSGQLLETR